MDPRHPATRRRSSPWRLTRSQVNAAVAGLVLIAGFAATAFAWRAVRDRERERSQVNFDRWAFLTRNAIVRRIDDYAQVLRGIGALFALSDSIPRDEWTRYVDLLKLDSRFPGIVGVGYCRPVGDTHCIVEFKPTGDPQSRPVRFDPYRDPVRHAVMDQARDTGEPVVTGRVHLPADRKAAKASPGIVMYSPVYASNLPHGTPDERRKALTGFVLSPFRLNELMAGLTTTRPKGLDFEVYDGDAVRPDALVYADDGAVHSGTEAVLFSKVLKLSVARRKWTMEMSARPQFAASVDHLAEWLVAAGGGSLSMLLAGLFIAVDHRRREAERGRASQLLTLMLESGPDAMILADDCGLIAVVNRTAEALFGYARAEMRNQPLEMLVPGVDAARIIDAGFLESGTARTETGDRGWIGSPPLSPEARGDVWGAPRLRAFTAHARRKDGSEFPVEISLSPMEAGGRRLIVTAIRDVTERQQAEEALRESETRFRQMAENIDEVFFLFNAETNEFLYVSPAFESLWGRSRESLYADRAEWLNAIHAEDRERVGRDSIKVRREREHEDEYRIVRPDGSVRVIRERSFPIRSAAGHVHRIVAIAEDVTDQHRLEAQLRQSQKMEAIGTLAGGIAHDFNNILGAILGYTELAAADATDNAVVLKHLDGIGAASRRAADLVRRILAFSRHEEHARRPITLAPVVTEALDLLRASLPAAIEIRRTIDADVPAVVADLTQIHQVVMNLCTNAWHAMEPSSGTIEVALGVLDVDEDFARMHVGMRPGRHATLSVRDTGRGMDQATLERIFDPFFTTKAPGQGTGLGLATVHAIVRSHGGTVSVYSEPGTGTIFHVYLPAAGIGADQAHARTATPRAAAGCGQHILFVDDEAALADWGRQTLNRLGYRVTSCTSVEDAFTILAESRPPVDAVVTDLSMPVMNGLAFAERVRVDHPGMPIILTSGYAGEVTAEAMRRAGISDLLIKPNTTQALADALQRVLPTLQAA